VSLRLRLLLAVGAIAIIALVVADVATYNSLRSFLYKQVDQTLASYSPRVTRLIDQGTCPGSGDFGGGTPNGGAPPGAADSNPGIEGFIPFVELLSTSGQVVDGLQCPVTMGTHTYSPTLPSHITGFTVQPDGTTSTYFTAGSTVSGGPEFRVQVTQDVDPTTGQKLLAVEAQPLNSTNNTLHTLLLIELAVTAIALVLAMAGGWWLVRLGLRPLEDVERTAESIAAGNLDQRVPGADDTTEVGRLARALNVMLERIESAFAARVASESRLKESDRHLRQFVADASHELRTPIAAVSAYAELFERGAAQRPEDLPRVISGIRSETARMDRLVSDLLDLARLDEGLPMHMVPLELVSVGADAVHTALTVGPDWPVQFHPVEILGDSVRLRQVIDNLLANVRAHTPVGTNATVRVDQDGAVAQLTVADTGPGMPSEAAARVFERFYRVDSARDRAHGGSGLGLSIVAAIVAAHGGTVSAASAPGRGMTVSVRIPVIEGDNAGVQTTPAMVADPEPV
jgi:signal transduction histidine kinase